MKGRSAIYRVLAVALCLAGCSAGHEETAHGNGHGEETMTPAGGAGMDALVGDWQLVFLDTSRIPDELPSPATISFAEDGTVAGSSGVNRYTARIDPTSIASGEVSFGLPVSTRMAGPQEAMNFETLFLEQLSSVSRWAIEGKRLVLYAGDRAALTFTRSQEDPR